MTNKYLEKIAKSNGLLRWSEKGDDHRDKNQIGAVFGGLAGVSLGAKGAFTLGNKLPRPASKFGQILNAIATGGLAAGSGIGAGSFGSHFGAITEQAIKPYIKNHSKN